MNYIHIEVNSVDQEHKYMFEQLQKLEASCAKNTDINCSEIKEFLKGCVLEHMTNEEHYIEHHKCSNAENHKLAHDVLRHKVSVILGFDPAEVLKMEVVKEIQSLKLAIEDHQENFDCKYFNNNQQ